MNHSNNYELIIPVAASDFYILKDSINLIKEKLKPKFITIISSKDIVDAFNDAYGADFDIRLLDEDFVYPGMSFSKVKECMRSHNAEKKTGWMFQQFLKYAYAYISDSEYYVTWDADTIPLQNIIYFENGKPIFFLKEEYHKPYFNTIEKLIQSEKLISSSFIAENMIFKAEFVKELVTCIESAGKDDWYINIINAISDEDMQDIVPGFSEFETYGTYVLKNHPGFYNQKSIRAIRRLKKIMKNIPDEKVRDWLGKTYFSASFEKWDETVFDVSICKFGWFRKIVHPHLFIKICFMIVDKCGKRRKAQI